MKTERIFIQGLNKEVTFWIGTSKEDNDGMIDKASPNDIWFHVNNSSSCHVICRMIDCENISKKGTKYIVKMGALLCKNNTNKWKTTKGVDFVYCTVKHLTKTDIVGCVSVSNGKYITV